MWTSMPMGRELIEKKKVKMEWGEANVRELKETDAGSPSDGSREHFVLDNGRILEERVDPRRGRAVRGGGGGVGRVFPRVGDGERFLEGGDSLVEFDRSGRGCKDTKSEREEGGGSGENRNAGRTK